MTSALHKTRRKIILGVVVLALAGIAFPVVRNQSFLRSYPKRFAGVQDGVLYRSAQPTTRQLANLVKDHGLRTLLIVREGNSDRVDDEIAFAREHRLNVVHIPVVSRKPIPEDQVRRFFACVDDPANRPILIHCSAGRHRTGYLCALYRIERQGWSVERAMEEMLSFGFDTEGEAVVLDQLRQYAAARATTPMTTTSSGPSALGGRSRLNGRLDDAAFAASYPRPVSFAAPGVLPLAVILPRPAPMIAQLIQPRPTDPVDRLREQDPSEPLWLIAGLGAQAAILLCLLIHMIVSAKRHRLMPPVSIGYVGLLATLVLMTYASRRHDVVFMVGQFVNTLICLRLLVLIRRSREAKPEQQAPPKEEPSRFPVVAPDSADQKLPPAPR